MTCHSFSRTTIFSQLISALLIFTLDSYSACPICAFGCRAVSPQRRVEALLADLEGQVTQAVSREDWFRKWGRHYLPSLQRAHELRYDDDDDQSFLHSANVHSVILLCLDMKTLQK